MFSKKKSEKDKKFQQLLVLNFDTYNYTWI